MKVRETLVCRGHPNVSGSHRTTFEVTREAHLSPAGHCIIGVGADKGAADLSDEFRRALADSRAVLHTTLTAGEHSVCIRSRGHERMTLDHPADLVWRKSGFVCGRTVGIFSDHAAATLPRNLIAVLQEGAELAVEMVAVIRTPAR
ncbi:MAG: DUF371 domain-containing protein [Methanomicrobiaceae archaeon]|nr:DUF371 domain-containing protein [Methanomicrobiaceae archaeon]